MQRTIFFHQCLIFLWFCSLQCFNLPLIETLKTHAYKSVCCRRIYTLNPFVWCLALPQSRHFSTLDKTCSFLSVLAIPARFARYLSRRVATPFLRWIYALLRNLSFFLFLTSLVTYSFKITTRIWKKKNKLDLSWDDAVVWKFYQLVQKWWFMQEFNFQKIVCIYLCIISFVYLGKVS